MFRERFDPRARVVRVHVVVSGPLGARVCRFILDTGTRDTVVSTAVVDELGYSARMAIGPSRLVGADETQEGYRLGVDRLEVFGLAFDGCHVRCHDLDERFDVEGLIGMDLLAGRVVTIDCVQGELTVA